MLTGRKEYLLAIAMPFAVIGYVVEARSSDSVQLKNGTTLQGEVTENKAGVGEIVLLTGKKELRIPRDQIDKLQMDMPARAEFQRRMGALKVDDAKGLFALYAWAKGQHLFGLAEKTLQATLTADPHHAEAQKALALLGRPDVVAEAKPGPSAGGAGGEIEGLYVAETARSTGEQAHTKRVDFTKKVLEQAKVLAQTGARETSRQEALNFLLNQKEESGDILLGALDFRRVKDDETRLGALKGLTLLKPAGPRVSPTLAWSAVMDPREELRAATAALIKERKDDNAIAGIIKHLIGAFDESGNLVNGPVKDAAVKALHSFNDGRIGDALIYYCVMELRPTVTELANFSTRFIASFTVLQGANVTIIVPLTFPIQFPELAIRRVRTTACAPASALNAYAEAPIGGDLEAMKRWANR